MKILYQTLALGGGLFFVALAFSLGNVNSMFIDFTQLPAEQLSVFRYTFFVFGVGLWLTIPVVSK